MADSEGSTAVATPAQQGEPTSQPSSTAAPEPRETGSSWLNRILGRGSRESDQQASTAETAGETEPKAETPAQPAGRVVSDEELSRLVQAEVDRREAKRAADSQRQQRQHLRRTDPYAYAQQDEEAEQRQTQTEQAQQVLHTVIRSHDAAVLDPLIALIPADEAKKIVEGAGAGLEGRQKIVSGVLDALKKQWMAEGAKQAEERARKNPAFRKEILTELRGTREEPELGGGGNAPAAPNVTDMNTWMRKALGK